ncbi:hypothetical protein CPB84DRAFT_1794655 [Gymnopilus junonius]|uniref:Uncharacterized protein n=1 Tax=Gymnopilus junonius TaxID=109634 RepID=A0A9P5NBY9_GYMJU|nr:hypothetical protein CPB84DRAFT_1794655 [Gymnopilus junonius]
MFASFPASLLFAPSLSCPSHAPVPSTLRSFSPSHSYHVPGGRCRRSTWMCAGEAQTPA